MHQKMIGIFVCMLLIATSLPVVGTLNIEKVFEGEAINPVPDLNCEGEIVKKRVDPGSTVTGSFTVENIGELGSQLDWEVTELPDFGTNWTISPSSGEDLTPEDDPITVDVSFTAPTPEEPSYYGGVIKVSAVGNPDDKDLIAVNINVGRNRAVNKPLLGGYNRYDFNIPNCNYDNIMSDVEPLAWWGLWPDFPGRYEPMFDVHDIEDFGQTAWGLSSDDFDNDGFLDFAVCWATSPWTQSTISVFYNDGENGFTQDDVYTITEPSYQYFDDLDSGDYDLDGDIDIMFTYTGTTPDGGAFTNGTVNIIFNDGANNFINPTMVANLPKIDGEKRIHPQIACADYDQNGDIDFLVGENSGLVEFYKNDGTGSFSSAGLYDFGRDLSWGLSSADFDNDGDIDFIVTECSKGSDDGYTYLVLNDGSESCFNESDFVIIADIPPRPSFFAGPIMGFGCLQSIDYNDDGKMDFIFSGGDSVFLYIQNETRVFDYFHIMRLPWPNAEDDFWDFYHDDLRNGGIAVGDFNGDDLDDMIIGGVQGVVRICYNRLVLVDMVHPDRSVIYVNNGIVDVPFTDPIMIYSFVKHGTSIAIGDLTVEAKGLVPLQKVEFYIGIRKIYTDDSEPFEWKWDRFSFRRCKVKAVAYDMNGNKVGFDDTIVWKFL